MKWYHAYPLLNERIHNYGDKQIKKNVHVVADDHEEHKIKNRPSRKRPHSIIENDMPELKPKKNNGITLYVLCYIC